MILRLKPHMTGKLHLLLMQTSTMSANFNPSATKTKIFRETGQYCSMVRSSVDMILIMHDIVLVLQKEGFQLSIPFPCCELIGNISM